MSQMKPYCFKCGAELDPEAIYCPECGRLQRSMVVRMVEPGAPPGPAPPTRPPHEQPPAFTPDREAQPTAEPPTDQSHHYDPAPPHSDQPDPYASQQHSDQGWYAAEEQPDAHGQPIYDHEQWQETEPPAHEQQPQPGAGQVYAQHDQAGQVYAEPSWSDAGHDPYGHQQPDPGYAAHDEAAQPYDHRDEGYGQPGYGYAEPEPPPPPPPGHPLAPPGPPEPPSWQREPAGYGQPEPAYGHPEPARAYSTPGEPVYSSSAPLPESEYDSYTPAGVNPYAPPYQPDDGGRGTGPSRTRLLALVAAGLLGLFLIGIGIGHVIAGGGSASPSAAAPPQTSPPPVAPPTSRATATPAPTPTPDTGNAKFQKLTASIPGRCTTAQGCPVQITLKNNGDRGSGTVTLTLTDGTNPVATFTGPIPATDAGQTVTVNGFATGDQLAAYLRSNGIVYISTVDVKNGA
jgi:hypothetical protein